MRSCIRMDRVDFLAPSGGRILNGLLGDSCFVSFGSISCPADFVLEEEVPIVLFPLTSVAFRKLDVVCTFVPKVDDVRELAVNGGLAEVGLRTLDRAELGLLAPPLDDIDVAVDVRRTAVVVVAGLTVARSAVALRPIDILFDRSAILSFRSSSSDPLLPAETTEP